MLARMSLALFFSRTPVRKVPPPRAWSPAPSGPPSATTLSIPPRTCTEFLCFTNGASVRLHSKSLPSAFGHHVAGIAPFGKNMNAIRSGAPPAVVPSLRAAPSAASRLLDETDAKAGSARRELTPRRNRRRSSVDTFVTPSLFRTAGPIRTIPFRVPRITQTLERGRLDDTRDQQRRLALGLVEPGDDFVQRVLVR